MPKRLRNFIGIFATVIVFLLIAAIIGYKSLISSVPELNGDFSSTKISDEVTIYFDSLAVPHIEAKTETDAAFALGFLHARERMFQMDLARRAGSGKLSEIFGSKTLAFDKLFITVGMKRIADSMFAACDDATKQILIAYADGVNHYLNDDSKKLPIEFNILDYEPAPWQPQHSLIIVRMMAWELNIAWWEDVAFTHIYKKLGDEMTQEILPDYPADAPAIIDNLQNDLLSASNKLVSIDRSYRQFMNFYGTNIGSNNWVVSGKKSRSGKPIIANDPHLAYQAPGRWYAAVINAGRWNAAGVSIPGIPGIVIGKNNSISWALTNVMADEADFFIETVDSTGKNYVMDGKPYPFKTFSDTIFVKDSSAVFYEWKETRRGPVVSEIHPYEFLFPNEYHANYVLSMRWAGRENSNEYQTFYKINLAQNWEEFKSALQTFLVPAQNFVYADTAGNIGYYCGAKIIDRTNANPMLFDDGSKSMNDWNGFGASPASLFNPEKNYIATANNLIDRTSKTYIGSLWEPSSRIERIDELLTKKKLHSKEDFISYQNDFVSPFAKRVAPHILSAFENVSVKDKNLKIVLDLLRKWDYSMTGESQPPAIFNLFLKYVLKNIYEDELGSELFREFVFVANVPYRSLEKLLAKESSNFFDDKNTPEYETKNDIIRKSLSDALSFLETNYGDDVAGWQWNKIHRFRFKHFFSGQNGMIDNIVDIGPFPIGGDGTTIFNTEYSFHKLYDEEENSNSVQFENSLGPSMRFVYDLSAPNEFQLILTTGQSGNIFSSHYKNMVNHWLKGEAITIRTDAGSFTKNKDRIKFSVEAGQ